VFLSRIERAAASARISATTTSTTEDRQARELIAYEITGDGFLRHMVRTIVGSLVEIGLGRRDDAWLRSVIASRDRTQAGPTAPACGLFLVGVDYEAATLAAES
jgi:tRNA pseudouridine38-40 synthase